MLCLSVLCASPANATRHTQEYADEGVVTGDEAVDWSDAATVGEIEAEQEVEVDDDTAEVDTETTADFVRSRRGWKIDGDLRPIYDNFEIEERDGDVFEDDVFGFRARVQADWGITEGVHLGARLAGTCFTEDNCDPEWVMDVASPAVNGLEGGQITFDELYLHWFRPRGSLAFGRLQTRFVLRSGVYAKPLDRNDSNNVNVTWTDGFQGMFRAQNGWNSSFILQRNASDGTGSIRRGQLDFEDQAARNTYFLGFENIESWGLIVQRGFDISYLPSSLLEDGLPEEGEARGNTEDYWGLVGRLAMRWPNRPDGMRFRGGMELAYAPNVPTAEGANLESSVDGLAWDVVASLMDFYPDHSIGLNYGQTGAGWMLSPQFRPNEELIEIRYQWRPDWFPLVEVRFRWRNELEQQVGTAQKRDVFDLYARLTWEFTIKDRRTSWFE
ncbi:MAG: hypothetical protein ACR2P6_07300 [Gammaproteobacteria bacterium]